jgi:DNA-binding NarL/FixJ family response regulator
MSHLPDLPRVLAVDDHPVVLNGMKELLLREFAGLQFDPAPSAAMALEKIWANTYDLVLLDLSLGGRSGLEVLSEIRKHCPETPVLVVSMYPEEIYGVRSVKAGAAGYLRKDAAHEEVVEAVTRVLCGHRYISADLAQILAGYIMNASDKPTHDRLSAREFEVLCLIGKGMGMKQIGIHLNLSIKTVSTYRARILSELGFKTTAALIRYCIENGLADD